jgi:hypothetical protein
MTSFLRYQIPVVIFKHLNNLTNLVAFQFE